MVRVVLGLALACAVALTPQSAPAAAAGACGLPDTTPLWLDYVDGTVPFATSLFAKSGIVAATGALELPAPLQSGGARNVFWEMHLGLRVGTTAAPADPASIPGVAEW